MRGRIAARAFAVGLVVLGCTWTAWTPGAEPRDPDELPPSRARLLVLGEPQRDEIVCDEGFCQQWYRLDVPEPGRTLRVEVTPEVDSPPMARVVLHDGLGNVIARANNQEGRPLAIASPVEGNVAAILVQSGKGHFPYSVSATLE
jgi:hypothetical protein